MRMFLLLLCASLLSANVYADTNDSGVKTKWGYLGNIGPERWGQLSPEFAVCDTGKAQSPINIPKKTSIASASLKFNYHPAQLYLLEDGPTLLMINSTQTIFNDGHTIQVNFNDNKETLNFNGTDYQLVQFHIHSPSENLLRSASQPLEIHFVHQGKDGKVAVVGVFVKAGEANDELKKVVEFMPNDHNSIHEIQGENINPADLMPEKKDYYSFEGSLTTPPCSEGLQWIVMANPITASPSQILNLRNVIMHNARPIQRLNGRTISYSGA
jgi:carbonic anhydrase